MRAPPNLAREEHAAAAPVGPGVVRAPFIWDAVAFGSFLVAFYIAYRYAMTFSHATPSPFWFPISVLLSALLLTRPRWWPLVVLGTLPIRLFSDVSAGLPVSFLLETFAIDSAGVVLTAAALRRLLANPLKLDTIRDYSIYGLFAVVLVPAAAALGGAAARSVFDADFWTTWQQWFLGDAVTHLVVTPTICYWVLTAPWQSKPRSRGRALEAALLSVGLVASSYVAFVTQTNDADFTAWRIYVPVPFLLWAAIRFGMLGATGAITCLVVASVGAALHGFGPFSGRSPEDTAVALQHFLIERAAPLYFIAILVEEKGRVERSLRDSERLFRTTADSAPVMIWLTGADGLCEFVNQRWTDFSGRTLEQERGTGWTDGIHPDDRAQCLEVIEGAKAKRGQFEHEYRMLSANGDYRWILDVGVPRFSAGGEFAGYVGCAVDVTERRERAEALAEANRTLAHASRLVSVGTLTAMIAHEVNQPLCAIRCNAEAGLALLDSSRPRLDELREILTDICRDDQRADDIVTRVRLLSRKRDFQPQALDLHAVIADVLRLAGGDATRRQVRVITDLDPALPPVRADVIQVQQVLLNLLVNAFDAMRDTPVAARKVKVVARASGDDLVEIAITDRGHGIPPEDLPRIFDSFFSTKADGMGMGLSIARSIIETNDGRIWAENNADHGATFRFQLRVAG
jgi:PAS domain S-box-containing protein